MPQPVAFFEVASTDHERAQKFYTDLFDWTLNTNPSMDGYALVDTGGTGAILGGIGPASSAEDAGVRFYVRVDDIKTYITRRAARRHPGSPADGAARRLRCDGDHCRSGRQPRGFVGVTVG
jgi:predicted enzyme related to lactoylglutathione lyase